MADYIFRKIKLNDTDYAVIPKYTAGTATVVSGDVIYSNYFAGTNIKITQGLDEKGNYAGYISATKYTAGTHIGVVDNANGTSTFYSKYTPGANVTFTDGDAACVISATDTKYSAGSFILVDSTNKIHCTYSAGPGINISSSGSISTTYSAGNNITISSSGSISATNTKNTAGSSQSSSKLYVIGAASQNSTGVTTYSKSNVYIDTDASVKAVAFYQTSDENLKTFTEDYDVNLDEIKNIKTGKFYWKSDENMVINSGITAQSVEEYFPELVHEDEDGIKSVNYDGLAVVAIAAIKKLTERIEQLEQIVQNK